MEKVVCVVIDFMGVGEMFRKRGCRVVGPDYMSDAELVVWTGGEDINPAIYGEEVAPRTWFNSRRDGFEIDAFTRAKKLDIPMTGICRGAQLLNCLLGGKLYQDVDGHHMNHIVEDIYENYWWSTSIHHQMMIRSPDSILIAWAQEGQEKLSYANGFYESVKNLIDPEVVFYPKQKALLIQGHPELGNSGEFKEMQDMYFWYLKELLGFEPCENGGLN